MQDQEHHSDRYEHDRDWITEADDHARNQEHDSSHTQAEVSEW